jgi:hypothetical protein
LKLLKNEISAMKSNFLISSLLAARSLSLLLLLLSLKNRLTQQNKK